MKVNKETAQYIIVHFPSLLNEKERLALQHRRSLTKLSGNPDPRRRRFYLKKGWLSEDSEVLGLLKDGYDRFAINVGNRILQDSSDSVFLNNCPECHQLARTPQARQCRHCGHSWHEIVQASFRLNSSFQLTGRHFFLTGGITRGSANIGNYIDLTMVGLNAKPKIETIELALKVKDGVRSDDIALGTSHLTQEQKNYLVRLGSFGTPFDIINQQ